MATSLAIVDLSEMSRVNVVNRSVITYVNRLPWIYFGNGPRISIAINFKNPVTGNSFRFSWCNAFVPLIFAHAAQVLAVSITSLAIKGL